MPDQLQLRGGTTAQHSNFTGASKEVTVDTDKKTVVVHDGIAPGGFSLLRQDGSNSALALGSVGTPSLKWDANTGIYSPGEDQLAAATNGVERVKFGTTATEVVFNDTGVDYDFRIEGDTNANLFFVDASTDRVGIGTSSPQSQLQVLDQIKVSNSSQSQGSIVLGDGGSASFNVGIARWNGGANTAGTGGMGYFSQGTGNIGGHYFYTGDAVAGSQTARMVITSGGLVGIGTTGPGARLGIEAPGTMLVNLYDTTYAAELMIDSVASNVLRIRGGTGDDLTIHTGGSERICIDSSGRLLVGTSSVDGLATNASPVVAGLFKSTSGSATLEHNTTTTLFTAQNESATYIFTALRSAVGNASGYNAVSLISSNSTVGGSASLVASALKTAANITISVSGATVQAIQTSGGAANLQWTLTRVA